MKVDSLVGRRVDLRMECGNGRQVHFSPVADFDFTV